MYFSLEKNIRNPDCFNSLEFNKRKTIKRSSSQEKVYPDCMLNRRVQVTINLEKDSPNMVRFEVLMDGLPPILKSGKF